MFNFNISNVRAATDYTIDGDVVYVNDTNCYIAAYPHTINTSQYVYVNVTSKKYEGQVDFAFGFDRDILKPRSLELYKPRNITTEQSVDLSCYTIDSTRNVYNSTYLEVVNQRFLVNASYANRSNPWVYNGTVWVYYNNTILENNVTIGFEWKQHREYSFDKVNVLTSIIYWNVTEYVEWKDVRQQFDFDKKSFSYQGMNTWYLANHTVIANKKYCFRFFLQIQPKLGKLDNVKYCIAFKPQSETLAQARDNGHLYVLDPWLAGGWDQRVQIDIDSGDIDVNLASFPVLLFLSNSSSGQYNEDVSFIFDEVGVNSLKIAVTVGEDTETYVEVEKWDSANEQAWLWANVTATAAANQTLYLYYDNDHADNNAYVGVSNSVAAQKVWDSDYKLVYHMCDGVDNQSIYDSTSNNKDGTKRGANDPVETTTAQIGDAQDFSTDWITFATLGTIMDGTSDFTIQLWSYADTLPSPAMRIRFMEDYYCRLLYVAGDKRVVGFHNGTETLLLDPTQPTVTWTSYTVTFETGSWIRLFENYTDIDNENAVKTSLLAQGADNTIGADNTGAQRYWDGKIDEIRVSSKRRENEWIKADYETQRDHLLDWYSQEDRPYPRNEYCIITDMDDTDNLYAQKQLYTLQYNVSHPSGFATIDYAEARFQQAFTFRVGFRFDEDTATFSLITANGVNWDLDTGSCSNISSGTFINITFKISPMWISLEESDVDIDAYVIDENTENSTDRMHTDYVDVITNLVTDTIECTLSPVDRTNVSDTVQVDFNVSYADNPASSNPTDYYPPDAEFTSVSVYNSTNNNMGTDFTIVNGEGSVSFNMPPYVGSYDYNLYVDMADADYSDGEETPVESIIADRIMAFYEATNDTYANYNQYVTWYVQAVLEYDDHILGVGDNLTCAWGDLAYDSPNFWFNNTRSTLGNLTMQLTSGREATFNITAFAENITETAVIFTTLTQTFQANNTRPNLNNVSEICWCIIRDYDDTIVSEYTFNMSRNATLWRSNLVNCSVLDVRAANGLWIYSNNGTLTDTQYDLTGYTNISVSVQWGGILTVEEADENTAVGLIIGLIIACVVVGAYYQRRR